MTHERLCEVLQYEPHTGQFTWLKTVGSHGPKGSIAGKNTQYGYRAITLDGYRYLAHRLAWFYMTGEWPTREIDHRDTRGDNNAWCNLRPATRAQNNQNKRRARSNSTTGLIGVYKGAKSARFGAKITTNGVCRWLGTFDTAKEAHAVYIAAKKTQHTFWEKDVVDMEEAS